MQRRTKEHHEANDGAAPGPEAAAGVSGWKNHPIAIR